jgi:hypothetical protein
MLKDLYSIKVMERKEAKVKRQLTKRDTYTYEESEYTGAMGPEIVNIGPFFVFLVSNKYKMAILNEDQKKFLVENFSINLINCY